MKDPVIADLNKYIASMEAAEQREQAEEVMADEIYKELIADEEWVTETAKWLAPSLSTPRIISMAEIEAEALTSSKELAGPMLDKAIEEAKYEEYSYE